MASCIIRYPRFVIAISLAVTNNMVMATSSINSSFEESYPTIRVFDITQFGMQGDKKYIFCEGADCPNHTIKHISEPQTFLVTPTRVEEKRSVADSPASIKPNSALKLKKHKARMPAKKAC